MKSLHFKPLTLLSLMILLIVFQGALCKERSNKNDESVSIKYSQTTPIEALESIIAAIENGDSKYLTYVST